MCRISMKMETKYYCGSNEEFQEALLIQDDMHASNKKKPYSFEIKLADECGKPTYLAEAQESNPPEESKTDGEEEPYVAASNTHSYVECDDCEQKSYRGYPL